MSFHTKSSVTASGYLSRHYNVILPVGSLIFPEMLLSEIQQVLKYNYSEVFVLFIQFSLKKK